MVAALRSCAFDLFRPLELYLLNYAALAKRSLFLLVAGVAAWVEGYYLAQYGFEYVAFALLITVILAIGWMRTYWTG